MSEGRRILPQTATYVLPDSAVPTAGQLFQTDATGKLVAIPLPSGLADGWVVSRNTTTGLYELRAPTGGSGGGGGGGGSYAALDPMLPDPSATLAYEFDTSGGLTGLTGIYTSDAGVVYDVATTIPKGLWMRLPDHQYHIKSFIRALPADAEWTIHTAVSHAFYRPNDSLISGGGIIISDGNTAGAGTQRMPYLSTHGGISYSILNWQNFGNGPTGSGITSYASYDRFACIRLRKMAGVIYAAWSPDGREWFEITYAPGITINYFGVGAQNYTGLTGEVWFPYLRYYNVGNKLYTGGTTGPGGGASVATQKFSLAFPFTAAGQAWELPMGRFPSGLKAWAARLNASGSATFQVQSAPNITGSYTDMVGGGTGPAVSGALGVLDTDITDWADTGLAADEVIKVVCASLTTATQATLTLHLERV